MNNVFYFHSAPQDFTCRNSNNSKKRKKAFRMTVAGRLQDGKLHLNSSLCSNTESFIKSSGRHIALTRIVMNEANKPNTIVEVPEGSNPIKLFVEHASHMCLSRGLTLKPKKVSNGENLAQ